MTTYTVVATGTTDRPAVEIEARIREALSWIGFDLIPCAWAPDVDTITDAVGSGEPVHLIDLN